jgi:hypothetical protein
MPQAARRIGPIGTSTRLLVAAGLLYLALFHWTTWGLTWYDGALTLGLLTASLVLGLAARRYASGPLDLTGPPWIALNCALIVALVANPYTARGAELFYGAALIVAAWRGQPGCEATVISNLLLGRDDQLGCPTFSPIDQAEARHQRAEPGQKRAGARSILAIASAPLACCWPSARAQSSFSRNAHEEP